MIKINFLGPIQKNSLEIKANNLKEVKNELSKYEDLENWLEISAIAVNDNFISQIDYELKDGDVISVLPPVCGG